MRLRLFFLTFSTIFTLLLFSNCEEVIDLDLPKGYKRLVIEGLITDQQGPHYVNISHTIDYSLTYNNSIYYETGAEVIIKDDAGGMELLKEIKPGIYSTDSNAVGVADRTYTLLVQTKDGRKFESIPELLKQAPVIDTIYYSLDYGDMDKSGNPGLSGFIEYQDPPNERNYYLKKQYEFLLNNRLFYFHTDMFSDKFFNGKNYKYQILSNFNDEVEAATTIQKIELYSLSENAFEYWVLVNQQTAEAGGRYDPPPAPLIGNIQNINDEKDYALGFFGASSISKAEILVKSR